MTTPRLGQVKAMENIEALLAEAGAGDVHEQFDRLFAPVDPKDVPDDVFETEDDEDEEEDDDEDCED